MTGNDRDDRLIRLESVVMHLEHEHAQMNDALIAQQREIDVLRQTVARLQAEIDGEQGRETLEVRDPLAEKPPHY